MKIQFQELDYGRLIFHYRKKKDLTQHELCHGICSITYLSKIENQKIDSNFEVVSLLMERLNVNISSINEDTKKLKNCIETLYNSIVDKDFSLIEYYRNKLENYSEDILSPIMIYYIQLVLLRYFLHFKKINSAKKHIEKLEKIYSNLLPDQKAYFKYFLGIYYCHLSNFKKGILLLEEAESLFKKENLEIPELHYHLSLTYLHNYNTSMAIIYAEKSLNEFNSTLNFSRALECQLISGVIYIRLKKYTKASKHFEKIINKSIKIKDYHILGSAIHNLGYINKEHKKYSAAKDHFFESLKYFNKSSNNFINTILELSQTLVKLGEYEEAKKYVEEGIKIANKNKHSENYIIQLELLRLDIDNTPYEKIEYITEKAIPYCKSSNNDALLIELYQNLGSVYEGMRLYKNSSKFYLLALNKTRSININS